MIFIKKSKIVSENIACEAAIQSTWESFWNGGALVSAFNCLLHAESLEINPFQGYFREKQELTFPSPYFCLCETSQ